MYGKFTGRYHLVVNGHNTDETSITYLSVVSKDIVRIVSIIVSFNDLGICA